MERLTARDEQGFAHYPYCFEKCNGDAVGIKCQTCDFEEKICNKLAEYEDLEEQGLLLKLPCKVGDTVYSITRDFISEYIVESIRIYEHSIQFYWKCTKGIYHNVVGFANFDIGKTVFLTKQEAQAALEKMKAGGVNES